MTRRPPMPASGDHGAHPTLRAHGLRVGYPRRVVLEDVELEAHPGDFIAVIGPNASGKSTLLKTLARLLTPLGGQVYLDGRALAGLSLKELARRLGVVLTERVNPGLMTAFEVAALGRYSYTDLLARLSPHDREVVLNALEAVGAGHLAHRPFNELSDGERQKVMIARALAQEPRLIILDEPTTHLDARNRVEILLLLRRLARERGITVLVSLHELELALRLADSLVVVSGGRVQVYRHPEEFMLNGEVESLYAMGPGVGFDPISYTVEVRGERRRVGPVFVVAGSGVGAPIYRLLNRLGYPVRTGVLHENDIDHHVASRLGAQVIAERAYQPISDEAYRTALQSAATSHIIIDAMPPIGEANRRNLELIEELQRAGRVLVRVARPGVEVSPGGQTVVGCTLASLPRVLEELESDLAVVAG